MHPGISTRVLNRWTCLKWAHENGRLWDHMLLEVDILNALSWDKNVWGRVISVGTRATGILGTKAFALLQQHLVS